MYAKAYFSSENSIVSQTSEVNFSESDLESPLYTPLKSRQSIDYSKFKTKMCRNFLMGQPCPFEDRCAFAHGHLGSRAHHAAPPPPPSYVETVVDTFQAAPPSYTDFVQTESPTESRSVSPPQYPSKYRYDPYNIHNGVVFEN